MGIEMHYRYTVGQAADILTKFSAKPKTKNAVYKLFYKGELTACGGDGVYFLGAELHRFLNQSRRPRKRKSAPGQSRTGTTFRSSDFKSDASTCFATGA